jgi:5-methylcytosine-specific restriction protein A
VIDMPYKPKKPCAHPGCPALTDSRYCPEHTKAERKRYDQYSRDPETTKHDGYRWQKIRAAFLSAHPLCELCKRAGRLTPATLVHHKRKVVDGGTDADENLMALCDTCHSRLHIEAGDGWGRKG